MFLHVYKYKAMDFYVYAESQDKPKRISVTNECQSVEELAHIIAHKFGLLVARGLGDEDVPYELRKFESGAVLGKQERIRDVLHDEESLVIRKADVFSSDMIVTKLR